MAIIPTEERSVTKLAVVDSVTRRAQLAWAIGSPPLLNTALHPHAALTATDAALWWQQWQPSTPPAAADNIRLGSDFEQLWQYWLSEHPHWQMLAHNLPIRDQNRTLGEFDVLVRNRLTDEQEHWELAVKFYLGSGDLDQPHCWHGPQFRDRLDRKLLHLRDEQLCWKDRLNGKNCLAALGVVPQRARAIVKGRLCYPLAQANANASFAADGHEKGLWATAGQWQQWLAQQSTTVYAAPLARTEWLAAAVVEHAQPLTEFLKSAPACGERPLALQLRASSRHWPMVFVVPEDWPDRANTASAKSATPTG